MTQGTVENSFKVAGLALTITETIQGNFDRLAALSRTNPPSITPSLFNTHTTMASFLTRKTGFPFMSRKWDPTEGIPRLDGKVFIVTG